LELRLKAGSAWEEHDLVFTGLHGNYLNPRYILKLFAQVLQVADLPHLRFHDLRHSAATLLLGMGVVLATWDIRSKTGLLEAMG
jgi:integrase